METCPFIEEKENIRRKQQKKMSNGQPAKQTKYMYSI